MFAAALIALLPSIPLPDTDSKRPPAVTVAGLNALVKGGHYLTVRNEKLGHVIEATGTVGVISSADHLPIVKLPGFWSAVLNHLPPDHGLRPGDTVTFRAMIVNEAYGCLQVWTYSFKKMDAPPAK